MAEGTLRPTGAEPNADEHRSERAGHWKRASISATVWWLAAVAASLAAYDVQDGESIGYAAGALLVPFVLAAGVAGFLAKRSSKPWRWGKHLVVTLVAGIFFAVISTIGRMSG